MASFELQLRQQDQMNKITFEQGKTIETVYDTEIPELNYIKESLIYKLLHPDTEEELDNLIKGIDTALEDLSKRETYKAEDMAQTRVLMSHYSLLTTALIRTRNFLCKLRFNDTVSSGW